MESATGFSQNVGMSRRTAASIKSACELDDAAIRTPSMPRREKSRRVSSGLHIEFGCHVRGSASVDVGDYQRVDAV